MAPGLMRSEGFAAPAVEIQKTIVGERTRDRHCGHPAERHSSFPGEIVTDGDARANGDNFGSLPEFFQM